MMSGWGYSESPLVDGDRLIVTPGGRTNTLVALDKKTGEKVWSASVPEGDGAGYASAVAADIAGEKQYVQFLGRGVVGVSARDGKFLWRYNRTANGTSNAATPIVSGDQVFSASAYNKGGALVTIKKQGDGFKADETYFVKDMRNQHGGVILLDGCLYGANGGNGEGAIQALVCVDFKSGQVLWQSKKADKGSIAYADGRIYYRTEDGQVVLIEPSAKEYIEKGRFSQPDRSRNPAWPHPIVANGKLYLRDQDVLLCYDVKAP
jgi:outer membrane protein assembly factor BamB